MAVSRSSYGYADVKDLRFVDKLSIRVPGDSSKACDITGIAEYRGDIVVSDRNKSVKLFDKDFTYLDHVNLERQPYDICVSTQGDVFVCILDSAIVIKLSIVNRKLVKPTQWQLDNTWASCRGICICELGLAVCVYGNFDGPAAILLLDQETGLERRKIDLNGEAARLCDVKDGSTIAVACWTGGVLFVDIHSEKVSPVNCGHSPIGITRGPDGDSVLVTDLYGGLYVVVESGARILKERQKGREAGRGICYLPQSHRVVRQSDKNTYSVEIYQLLPEPPATSVDESLPEEILKLDKEDIELYRQALANGKVEDHDVRLMIVGHFGVGKSTVRKRLLGQPVDIEKTEPTDGIEVFTRRCRVDLQDGTWTPLDADDKSNDVYEKLAKLVERQKSEKGETSSIVSDPSLGKTIETVQSEEHVTIVYERKTEPDPVPSSQRPGPGKRKLGNDTIQPGDEGSPSKSKRVTDPQRDEDDAILTELKTIMEAADQRSKDDNCALVSIWDFAGQSVFYSTHQVFLTRRAIYFLVTDMSRLVDDIVKEDCFLDSFGVKTCKVSEFVEFWLNSIHCYCGSTQPNVILVGTHADKLDPAKRKDLIKQYFKCVRKIFMEKDLKAWHVVEEEFAINNSNRDDPELDRLKDKVMDMAKLQPHWGKPIPARWITLEKALVELRGNDVKVMPRSKLSTINQALRVPLESEDELNLFLKFHHELGTVLYFSEPRLRDNILLDPQWVIDAMKCLITAEEFCSKKPGIVKLWKEFQTKGTLESDLLKAVWGSEGNRKFLESSEHLLQIMMRLDLIAVPREMKEDGSIIDMSETLYFVPCVLKDKPDAEVLKASHFQTTSIICFTTTSQFIPTALFNRFLAACVAKWPLYVRNKKPCIYCGCGIFQLDITHLLTVYFIQDFIQIWVTKMGASNIGPEYPVCSAAHGYVEEALKRVFADTGDAGEMQQYIKCPDAELDSLNEIIDISQFQQSEEVPCSCHEQEHILMSREMLNGWFGDKELVTTATKKPPPLQYGQPPSRHGLLSDKILGRIADQLGFEWQRVALELNVTQEALERIQMAYPQDSHRQIVAALIKWRDDSPLGENDKIEELIAALKYAGKANVAEELRQEYRGQPMETD